MMQSYPIFEQLPDQPMAHCATLTELADGTLLAAWFGGSYETAPDVVILAARKRPDESAWSQPQVIADLPGYSLGQPLFLVRPDGDLWLFFVAIMDRDWTSAQPYVQRSADGGRTWQPPEQLLDYPGLMFRSRPMVLADRIILPVYDEKSWASLMMISQDDGQSWRLTQPIRTAQGNIHPCLVQRADGSLLAYLRTGGSGGVIWRTESQDLGDTWSEATPTTLPNPNSGIDLLRLHSGALLLAFNDSPRLRTPLCVALAEQDEDWRWQRTVEDAHAEFSYPTLLQGRNGQIHLVYTYRRQHIHYACFDQAWLRESETSREPAH